MIREDRELLTELARLNREMAPLALRTIEGSASTTEQQAYAERLIAMGKQLRQRAEATTGTVIKGELLTERPLRFQGLIVEPHGES